MRRILGIGLLALLVRGVVFLSVLHHPEVVLQPDSRMYLSHAQGLLRHCAFVSEDKPDSLSAARMPGYPFFLASVLWVFGGSLIAVAACQILLDSVSCVLAGWLSEKIGKGTALLGGLLAAVNVNMVTYSHFILSDSLFLFFFTLFLVLVVGFTREPAWRTAIGVGLALGASVWVRSAGLYLAPLILPYLALRLLWGRRIPAARAFGMVLVIGVFFASVLLPWFVRNACHFGRFQLTSQAGEYFLQYVLPFSWQYSKGIPFLEGMKRANEKLKERAAGEGLDMATADEFKRSDFEIKTAFDLLKEEPLTSLAKAWVFGMVKTAFSPALIDFSYLLHMERPHFFSMEGTTFSERAKNFIFGLPGFFKWAVLGSIVLVGLSRMGSLWGFMAGFRHRFWETGLCLLIGMYFLMITGPFGYAKYRLPLEPILIVFLAAGLKEILHKVFRPDPRAETKPMPLAR